MCLASFVSMHALSGRNVSEIMATTNLPPTFYHPQRVYSAHSCKEALVLEEAEFGVDELRLN